jgi:hypothetical protein
MGCCFGKKNNMTRCIIDQNISVTRTRRWSREGRWVDEEAISSEKIVSDPIPIPNI